MFVLLSTANPSPGDEIAGISTFDRLSKWIATPNGAVGRWGARLWVSGWGLLIKTHVEGS
jgi:hypothetical protein